MGLIARAIEGIGIPTVAISLTKDLTLSVGVPRAVFVRWPLGRPLGEPDNRSQHRAVIFAALRLLVSAQEPGTLEEPGFRWRRENYGEPDWSQLNLE